MKWRLFLLSIIVSLSLVRGEAFAVSVRDVVYTTRHAGTVVFSHRDHVSRKGLANNCRACHDAIFDLKKKKSFTMSDMKKGRSCGACHDGNKAFSHTECARCHRTREIVFRVKATGPVVFSHKSHLAVSATCTECHPALFAAGQHKRATMKDMEKGKSCGACHNGTKAFAVDRCITCHPAREITYTVKETGPTHFSHTVHIQVAKCGTCHPKLYTPDRRNRRVGMAAMEKGGSCGACHDAKQAFSVKECVKCHPAGDLLYVDKDAGNVMFSHRFHSGLYSCADCHVAIYATARSRVKVSMQEMEAGKSCGRCHDGTSAFGVKANCESCHKSSKTP